LSRLTLSTKFVGRFTACLALIAILVAVLAPRPAHAQSSGEFESLEIALWPEFDRQAMLVIYRASLPATIPLPADVALPIPPGVELNAAAQGETDGRLADVDYTLTDEDGYVMVHMQVTTQLIQVEYYQDLTLAGADRRFDFSWPGGVSVASADLEVQNPIGVSDLTLSPAATDELVGEYGLTYKRLVLGSLTPTDRPSIRVRYTKFDGTLTVDSLRQASPTSQPAPTVGSTPEPERVVTWVVIALLLSITAVVAVLYVRVWRDPKTERSASKRHRPRRKSKSQAPSNSQSPPGVGGVFCHACGERVGAQDQFCRACGTRLRR
jgi:hypothetical protein